MATKKETKEIEDLQKYIRELSYCLNIALNGIEDYIKCISHVSEPTKGNPRLEREKLIRLIMSRLLVIRRLIKYNVPKSVEDEALYCESDWDIWVLHDID